MPTLPTSAVRVEEHQLHELASRARKRPAKQGYLQKAADAKAKKFAQRWCCIYQNLLFYFEAEASSKPLGMILLEGCSCKPVELPDKEVS